MQAAGRSACVRAERAGACTSEPLPPPKARLRCKSIGLPPPSCRTAARRQCHDSEQGERRSSAKSATNEMKMRVRQAKDTPSWGWQASATAISLVRLPAPAPIARAQAVHLVEVRPLCERAHMRSACTCGEVVGDPKALRATGVVRQGAERSRALGLRAFSPRRFQTFTPVIAWAKR